MSTKYVIQFTANSNFCLGVTTASPGTPVVLSILQGAGSSLTQWYLDANTGLISLVGSPDPQNPLYLDFQGTSPSTEAPSSSALSFWGGPSRSGTGSATPLT